MLVFAASVQVWESVKVPGRAAHELLFSANLTGFFEGINPDMHAAWWGVKQWLLQLGSTMMLTLPSQQWFSHANAGGKDITNKLLYSGQRINQGIISEIRLCL